MTSIIKLDSSPSQNRKHYNTISNHNRSIIDRNQNYYQQQRNTMIVDGMSTWSNNNYRYSQINGNNNKSPSISKRSDSANKSFESLKTNHIALNNSNPNLISPDSSRKLIPFDSIDNANSIEQSTNDNYYPLSNCLSISESNVSSSTSQPQQFQANRSCDKYGFFIDVNENDDSDNYNYETPSINELKSLKIKERKWLEMLNNWRYFINYKWNKIRDRCRKGIPHSLRSQAWYHLCGAHLQRNRFPNLYYELLNKKIPTDVEDDIIKDLHRQFPNHEMFADPNGAGQNDLYHVLKAFAAYRPNMGYCQAQAPIAAVFLMHMPAERTFWCLVALSRYYISGYFVRNLEDINIHGQMLYAFLKKYSPSAYNLLNYHQIKPELLMTEWFMCIYTRTLPWPSVLRVWDIFLCEGLTILFKIGLYLIDVTLKNETTKTLPTMADTCQKFRNMPKKLLDENLLINGIKRYELRDIDLLKEHKHQKKKFLKSKK